MSIVTYDEKFDQKVNAAAEALLKSRNVSKDDVAAQLPLAIKEARLVLLTAMAVEAQQ